MVLNEQKLLLYSRIINLFQDDFSAAEISVELNVPRTTVRNVIKKNLNHNTLLRLPGSGRKRSLDDDDVDDILSEIDKNPFTSSEKITNSIAVNKKKTVTSRTVRNYIRTTSFRSRVPRKRPFLSRKNITRRLELCNEWSSFEPNDWEKVIWSDETKINLFSSDGRQRVFRRVGEALAPENCLPTIKHGGEV